MDHSLNRQERIYQDRWDTLRLEWAIEIMDDKKFEKLQQKFGIFYENIFYEEELVALPIAH